MNFTSSYNSLCKNNANGREHTKKQALYYFVFRHNVQVHKNKIKKRKCSYEGNMNQHNECQVQNTTFSLMSLFLFGKWMWAQHGFSVWLLSGGWTFFFSFCWWYWVWGLAGGFILRAVSDVWKTAFCFVQTYCRNFLFFETTLVALTSLWEED